ncbi:glycosyltransferase [Bacillus nitratireducens]|uniref:glycosyltransferase n=1 Tax=Bacillus nitratireducens TaxID=2026193 RepID=UPI003391121B
MKILFIANHFPPINNSASIRILNYVNHLQMLGNEVIVLTPDYPKDFINYDKELLHNIDSSIKVIRVDIGSIYKKIYPRRGMQNNNVSPKKPNIKSTFKTYIKRNLAIPDSYFEWKNNAAKIGDDLIKKYKVDIIISTHETPSCHLVGLKLKKSNPKVRWITYWSDPWTFEYYRSRESLLKRNIEKWLERKVVKNSDKLLFTTEETKELYISNYSVPKNKTDIVYRGFEEYSKNKTDQFIGIFKKNKINLVHTGEIYTELRDTRPLIEALNTLEKEEKSIFDQINIVLVGGIDNLEIKEELKNIDCISLLPRVPYEEAQNYMHNSDGLLLWGNKYGSQIPGKVYEYFGVEFPILTILANNQDPVGPLMKEVDKGPIIYNNAQEIKQMIKEFVQNQDKNKHWYEVIPKYRWENVAKDLFSKILN